jgi:hypothetical protein
MAIDSILANAAAQIAGAIRNAARSTGTSFEYLLTTARIESNLNPTAQATTSSAKGLYQFIEQTWLGTIKQEGPAFGYGRYAEAITQGMDGRYTVADPNQYAAIMKLRSDPAASAMMAGAFTRTNAAQLAGAIGRQPTEGELYIAHFLGYDGAAKLIGAATSQPQASAAAMFPQAAAANRTIFYDTAGQARGAAQVYARLTGRYQAARSVAFATAAIPVASPAASPVVAPAVTPAVVPVHAQDTAGVTQAFAQAGNHQPHPADNRPLYQSMFTDRAPGPVTTTVSSLWGQGAGQAPPAAQARPLDLFTDIKPQARKL